MAKNTYSSFDHRWDQIKHLWQHEFTTLWIVPGLIVGLVIGFIAGYSVHNPVDVVKTFLPQIFGIGLTLIGFFYMTRWSQNRLEKQRLQNELRWQITNSTHDSAVNTLRRIRYEGWLTGEDSILKDSSLQHVKWEGAQLEDANLKKTRLLCAELSLANLRRADFEGASMWYADLSRSSSYDANFSDARLIKANFERATLGGATLRGANLWLSNFSGANLQKANLEDAMMQRVNLSGANLMDANLLHAELLGASFSATTALPDAKRLGVDDNNLPIYDKYWTPETDMTRYTDPNHPDFWEPEWVKLHRERGD